MAALAETPDEHSEDIDIAPSQGSEIKSEARVVPDEVEVEDAAEAEDPAEGDDADQDATVAGEDEHEAPSAEAAGEDEADEDADEVVADAAEAEADEAAAAAAADEVAKADDEAAEPDETAEDAQDEKPAKEFAVAGRRLGGRYRLERRVRGFGGGFEPEPQLWVGVDELLNRRVGVDLIAAEHPLSAQVARAARDAAAVADARFVQVLDAVQDEELLYIVTEWVPGAEQLQERLTDGPLSPAGATRMVRELAEAMMRAHEAEVAHGAMNPATVMITKKGEVKLRGLLVEATLSGQQPETVPAEERYAADVLALGQIWYAALTARWPGTESEYGLEAAPAEGAATYTPAQILAAVPKQVDATVCRALGFGEEDAFSTVKELTDAIRSLPRMRDEAAEPTLAPPRSRSARPTAAATPSGGAPQRPGGTWSPAEAPAHKPVWRRRGVLAVAACAVVALGTLAAFQFSGNNKNQGTDTGSISNASPHPSSAGTLSIPAGTVGQTLPIASDAIWDQDPSSDSAASAPNAYNGSGSGWTMTTQRDANWSTTNGPIGLVFDLGAAHTVDEAKFQVTDPGATVEVLTAPAGAAPPWKLQGPAASGYTLQKTENDVASGSTITVNFTSVSAQYVAIIFTQLQQQPAIASTNTPAGYRDTLLDVSVLGE